MYCWDLRVSALWTENQGPDFQKKSYVDHKIVTNSSQLRHKIVTRDSKVIINKNGNQSQDLKLVSLRMCYFCFLLFMS